jgi:type I restriction enzyme S subunit
MSINFRKTKSGISDEHDLIGDGWRDVVLEDLASEITVGYVGPMASEYVEDGIPFLRSQNVSYLTINTQDIKYIKPEFHQRLKKSSLKPGDVVIVRTGKPGTCAVIPPGLSVANCSDLVIVRCGYNLDAYFLAYFVNSIASHHVAAHLVGAVQQHFNVGSARTIHLNLPPIEEQKVIVSFLRTLDNKIELNQQMSETLEAVGEAVFKRWFVDFEFPNQEGKPYKSSGGEMVYNKELEQAIPRNWKVGCIEDVANVIGGGTPSTEIKDYFTSNGIPWLTPKDLSGYKGKFIEKGSLDLTERGLKNSSAKLMPKGTILFSSRAPIGYMAIALNDIATNQGFKSLVPKGGMNSDYLYYFMRRITPYVQSISSGSTFAEVSGSTLKQIKIIIPEITVIESYENFMSPVNSKMIVNSKGTKTLTNIRDLLLPKLMSGKIRVPIDNIMERQ